MAPLGRSFAQALVTLADTLTDDYDVVDFLYTLTEACVDVLHVTAAGVLLMDEDETGGLQVVAASSPGMWELELFECESGEGPCAEAYRRSREVSVADLAEHTDDWPRFVERATALGYRSVYARPLRLRSNCIGALNLFRDAPGTFSEDQQMAATALADMASIGILQARALEAADVEIHQLRHALKSRMMIEQAKGVLADRHGVTPDQAFDWLRRYARSRNAKLHKVARKIVDGELQPDVIRPT